MNIKLIIFDVDGTLTNGNITYHSDGTESKTYNAHDGLIVAKLPQLGIRTAVITGRGSRSVIDRMEYLNVSDIITNCTDKVTELNGLLDKYEIEANQTAYIGDDLNDYAAMKLCGFKACPNDAVSQIRSISDYISIYNGGNGAVRDICEVILRANGLYDSFLRLYGA